MPSNNIATLQTTDWGAEWIRLQEFRRTADDAGYWDKRAKSFGSKDAPSEYVLKFLEYAGIQPGETVLDMGCGTGSTAIPLAEAGHKVIAADFSGGMLDELTERAQAHGVQDVIETHRFSWTDDWEQHGIEPKSVDVCIASRSIATVDLEDALMRLHRTARKHVAITLATGSSPRTDSEIMAACGIDIPYGKGWQYAFNILVNHDIQPEVRYIVSTRFDTYDDADDAFNDFERMIDDHIPAEDEERRQHAKTKLRAWLAENLIPNEEEGAPNDRGDVQKALRLRIPRKVVWTFISWECNGSHTS